MNILRRRSLLLGGASLLALSGPSKAAFLLRGSGTAAQMQAAGIYDVKVGYGATGNTILLPDGAMSSSSNPTHLSSASASFVSGDVGKTVCVGGAGSSGTPLVTTIASISSGTVAVLNASCATTVSGAIVHYGTDDTTNIQTAINAAFMAGGGIVAFPPGIYMINGAFQDTSTYNAQLILPTVANLSPQVSVTLIGTTHPVIGEPPPTVLTSNPPPSTGSILFSPRNGSGTNPALLAAGQSGGTFNLVFVTAANLGFRSAYQNTSPLQMLQLNSASYSHVEDCVFDVDATSNQIAATQPVHGAIGLNTPAINNGAYSVVRDCYAFGYDMGFNWNEHGDFDNVNTYFCKRGFQINAAYHALRGGRIGVFSCKHGIEAYGGVAGITIQEYDSEHDDTATYWFNNPTDIVDSGNYLTGTLNYWIVQSILGIHNEDFSKTGGSNLTCAVL